MENWSEFEPNFKSKVVSVLVIDPNNEFPLNNINEVNAMYFDLANVTEKDFIQMGKWITQHIIEEGLPMTV